MNYKELKEWIKSAEYGGLLSSEWDGNDMFFETKLYKKDGKYYIIRFCNDEPLDKLGLRGSPNGEYALEEVLEIHKW